MVFAVVIYHQLSELDVVVDDLGQKRPVEQAQFLGLLALRALEFAAEVPQLLARDAPRLLKFLLERGRKGNRVEVLGHLQGPSVEAIDVAEGIVLEGSVSVR